MYTMDDLLDALQRAESGGRADAVSPKGAKGPYQFMDATARQYGVQDPHDPAQARAGAERYMTDLLKWSGGKLEKALAGWNWGQGNVERKGMEAMPRETQDFIPRVIGFMTGSKTAEAGGFDPEALARRKSGFDPERLARLKAGGPEGEPEAKPMTAGEVATSALTNLPGSAVEFGRTLAQPIIHPIKTAKEIGELGAGLWNTAMLGKTDPKVQGVIDFFKERYGSKEGLKNTLATDPVGVLADVSSVIGGAGLVTRFPQLARISQLTNPATLAAKGVSTAAKGIGAAAREVTGRTTGVGAEAIKVAAQPSERFREALRGKVSEGEVFDEAKAAGEDLKRQRGLEYREAMARLPNVNVPLARETVNAAVVKKLMDFKIGLTDKGEFDFSQSPLDRAARGPMSDLLTDVVTWKDTTALGLDTLKRRIDDFYNPSSTSRAITTGLRNTVKDLIVKTVPEYGKLTKEYAKTSATLKDFDRYLSMGNEDTARRKMATLFRDVNAARKEAVQGVSPDLLEHIAGQQMSSILPRGQLSSMMGLGGLGGVSLFNPKALMAAPLFSPRAVGEAAQALGRARPYARGLLNQSGLALPLFQAGQLTRERRK